MNRSMTSVAAALVERNHWPFVVPAKPTEQTPQANSSTSRIRQQLSERGPLTALQIACALELDTVGLVGALLKNDLASGRVICDRSVSPVRYGLCAPFDCDLRSDLSKAAALLRRHGFTVGKAKP